MRHSLSLKLTVAFLIVGITGSALAAGLTQWITLNEFGDLVLDEGQSDFISAVTAYYQASGSWGGVARYLPQNGVVPANQPQPEPPPPGANERAESATRPRVPPSPSFVFALVDQNQQVVVPGGPYQIGDTIPQETLEDGTEIQIDGQVVGVVLTSGETPELTPREELFLTRINWTLLYAALGASLLALVLGGLLARALTRPLRELTKASRAMAEGDLEQRVTVHSDDELGGLAAAFNHMSSELVRANQARRQMTADIAHDLRTPLTVIKGYAEALRDGDLPPTTTTFETVFQEAEHLSRLVQDLRMLSSADAGKLGLYLEEISPGDLLARAAAAHRPQASQLGISLVVEAPAGLPLVHVDPERMAQVLGNLVGNALRYTPQGGQISLTARQHADSVQITVQDTGAGINPVDLPYIFDRFYRGDSARQTDTGESGLGLAIAKSLVEAHGGTICATSTPGEGSVFEVDLPIRTGEKPSACVRRVRAQGRSPCPPPAQPL